MEMVERFNLTTGAQEIYYQVDPAYASKYPTYDAAFNALGEMFSSGLESVQKVSADLTSTTVVVSSGLGVLYRINMDFAGN